MILKESIYKKLQKQAIQILKKNWQGSFSIHCKGFYPFQWEWDSRFLYIGLAYFDITKVKKEIFTLLNAQWENGFIPHIIFYNKSDTYFLGSDYHLSYLYPKASNLISRVESDRQCWILLKYFMSGFTLRYIIKKLIVPI